MTAKSVSKLKGWLALVLLVIGLAWNWDLTVSSSHRSARQAACFVVLVGLLVLASWYRGRQRIRDDQFLASYLQKQRWDS